MSILKLISALLIANACVYILFKFIFQLNTSLNPSFINELNKIFNGLFYMHIKVMVLH